MSIWQGGNWQCMAILLDLIIQFRLSMQKLLTHHYLTSLLRHQYYSSSHTDHIKRSIVCTNTVRVDRLCPGEKYFLDHNQKVKSWFYKWCYPNRMINGERNNVKFGVNRKKKESPNNRVPYVLT